MTETTLNVPAPHPATLPEQLLLAQCRLWTGRRRGPGGQHRNKTETAVVIEHRPTRLRAEASERRSQSENRQIAIRRLRLKLAVFARCSQTADAAPSEMWRAHCRDGRIAVSRRHWNFPALLAEALDVLAWHRADVGAAAQQLGTTASQLTRLLKRHPAAIDQLNRERAAAGLRPLR